jgi:hypothetical protein
MRQRCIAAITPSVMAAARQHAIGVLAQTGKLLLAGHLPDDQGAAAFHGAPLCSTSGKR